MELQHEWDEAKRLSNIAKHGIDFSVAHEIDLNTAAIDFSMRQGEIRFSATNFIGNKLHTLIFTVRDNKIRVISLRRASRSEERRYEQSHRRRS